MQDLLHRLAAEHNITLDSQPSSWILVIEKTSEVSFEITVPHDVLEWYANARTPTRVIWTDWIDYYRVNHETTRELEDEMKNDLAVFVNRLSKSEIRISIVKTRLSKAKEIVEWNYGQSWKKISLASS